MYAEDDLLPISALQHLAFCERQWGLIHIDCIWSDNRLTAEGNLMHSRTESGVREWQDDILVTRGLRLRSFRLGLVGIADVCEFRPADEDRGVELDGLVGHWIPFPVEYKRGKPRQGRCDEIQLCAQALCVEEMLDCQVPEGAFFYGKPRRRFAVEFNDELRQLTEQTALRLHELTELGKVPDARYSARCRNCSLLQQCQPRTVGRGKSARRYLAAHLRRLDADEEDL